MKLTIEVQVPEDTLVREVIQFMCAMVATAGLRWKIKLMPGLR